MVNFPAISYLATSSKKVATTQKKVLKVNIQYVIFFVHRIEWDRLKIYKNFEVPLQLTWYYFGVLASWEKKPSYNDGGNANGAASCLRPLRGLADEVW